MVPLQHPHETGLWGFLFACLPILSAWAMAGGWMLSDDFSSRLGKWRYVARSSSTTSEHVPAVSLPFVDSQSMVLPHPKNAEKLEARLEPRKLAQIHDGARGRPLPYSLDQISPVAGGERPPPTRGVWHHCCGCLPPSDAQDET